HTASADVVMRTAGIRRDSWAWLALNWAAVAMVSIGLGPFWGPRFTSAPPTTTSPRPRARARIVSQDTPGFLMSSGDLRSGDAFAVGPGGGLVVSGAGL